jgi:hypothetical protein
MQNNVNPTEWWNLMINGELLASIHGKKSAEWFFKTMQRGDSIHTYSVEPIDKNSNPVDVASADSDLDDIQPARPW